MSAGTIPHTMPKRINSLKYLDLVGVHFNLLNELLFIVCLLKSSPNLVKLGIKVSKKTNASLFSFFVV